jgi:hypothetical protein
MAAAKQDNTNPALRGRRGAQDTPGTRIHANAPLRPPGHQPRTLCLAECSPDTARRELQRPRLDNLYVVDASFFPSSSSVNPALTIKANALRVGDHLKARLGASKASMTDAMLAVAS